MGKMQIHKSCKTPKEKQFEIGSHGYTVQEPPYEDVVKGLVLKSTYKKVILTRREYLCSFWCPWITCGAANCCPEDVIKVVKYLTCTCCCPCHPLSCFVNPM